MVTTATPVSLPPGLSELLSSLAAIPAEQRTPQQAALLIELNELAGETGTAKPRGFGAAPPPPTGAAVVRGLTRLSEQQLERTTSPPPDTKCWLCGR